MGLLGCNLYKQICSNSVVGALRATCEHQAMFAGRAANALARSHLTQLIRLNTFAYTPHV